MTTLTPRQLEVGRFFQDFRSRFGYSPTMQEVADAIGLNKVTAFLHVQALVRKGVLARPHDRRQYRGYIVADASALGSDDPLRVRLLGTIGDGGTVVYR